MFDITSPLELRREPHDDYGAFLRKFWVLVKVTNRNIRIRRKVKCTGNKIEIKDKIKIKQLGHQYVKLDLKATSLFEKSLIGVKR